MKYFVFSALAFFAISINIFSQDKVLIKVETNDLSMIFNAATNETVAFLYWGDKIKYPSSFLQKGFRGQPDTSQNFDPQIYPAYGGRFYLNPALKVTQEDGVLTTDLVYLGVEKKNLDDNRIETIIRLKDKLYPLIVDIHFVAY